METESNNVFQIVLSEETRSDTILCQLSPKISAVEMEIRWFKKTSCVCFYKNKQFIEGISYEGRVSLLTNDELERGNVSLQLKDLDDGDYLCQVISGDRTEEITIHTSLKSNEDEEFEMLPQTICFEKIDKEWTDKERMEMANSALSAVFHRLEKTHALKEDLQNINASVVKTQTQTEENDIQKEDLSKQMNMNTGIEPSKQEEKETENKINQLSNQQPGCLNQKFPDHGPRQTRNENLRKSNKIESESQQIVKKKSRGEKDSKGVKVCSILAGKTNNCDKKFITALRIENLEEVATVEESNIVLVFCPIVSRTGTDIEAALNNFKFSTESKLAVLVVLHHTFDKEKIVPDSSKCVNRPDILTVDCLFYEDEGLLDCPKNSDAFKKVVDWLIEQGKKTGVKIHKKTENLSNQSTRFSFFGFKL